MDPKPKILSKQSALSAIRLPPMLSTFPTTRLLALLLIALASAHQPSTWWLFKRTTTESKLQYAYLAKLNASVTSIILLT